MLQMQLLWKPWLWFFIFLLFICKVLSFFFFIFCCLVGWDFQYSSKYEFITPPPPSYLLIRSPEHPVESAAMLLSYQETHIPYMQALAAIFSFSAQHNADTEAGTNEKYHSAQCLLVGLQVTRVQEIHIGLLDPQGSCLSIKHSLCCTSCLGKFDGKWMLFVEL